MYPPLICQASPPLIWQLFVMYIQLCAVLTPCLIVAIILLWFLFPSISKRFLFGRLRKQDVAFVAGADGKVHPEFGKVLPEGQFLSGSLKNPKVMRFLPIGAKEDWVKKVNILKGYGRPCFFGDRSIAVLTNLTVPSLVEVKTFVDSTKGKKDNPKEIKDLIKEFGKALEKYNLQNVKGKKITLLGATLTEVRQWFRGKYPPSQLKAILSRTYELGRRSTGKQYAWLIPLIIVFVLAIIGLMVAMNFLKG